MLVHVAGTEMAIVPVSSTMRWKPAGGDDGRAAATESKTIVIVPVAMTPATSRANRVREGLLRIG